MISKNTEKMNEYIVEIFTKLYEQFPNPYSFNADIITGVFRPDLMDLEAMELYAEHPNNVLFCNTAEYLYREGYICSAMRTFPGMVENPVSHTDPGLGFATLTEKAIQVLSATPAALKGKSILDLSRTMKEEGVKSATKELVHILSQAGINFLDKHLKVRENA